MSRHDGVLAVLAALHPRDSAHRLGHPLDALAHARPFTRVVWTRNGTRGDLEAVLLEVDREKVPPPTKAP